MVGGVFGRTNMGILKASRLRPMMSDLLILFSEFNMLNFCGDQNRGY